MSKESAIRFLEELSTNEKAKELIEGREKPESIEELVNIYAETAAQLGENISAEDFRAAIEEMKADMAELEDDDIDNVAGGAAPLKDLQAFPGLSFIKAHAESKAQGVALNEIS